MLSVSPSSSPDRSLHECSPSPSPDLENSVVNENKRLKALLIALAVSASPLLAIPFIPLIAAALALNPLVALAIVVGISVLLFVTFFVAFTFCEPGKVNVTK